MLIDRRKWFGKLSRVQGELLASWTRRIGADVQNMQLAAIPISRVSPRFSRYSSGSFVLVSSSQTVLFVGILKR